jgi:membrane fusion protein (multidrug efflux system)
MSVFSQPSSVVRYSSFFLIALALSACNKTPQGAAPQGMPAMPPPEVAVITVKAQNTPVHFEYTAQVAASKEAEIRARVSGILLKKRYQEGQAISAGQPLFVLDSANYEAVVNNLEAQLASMQARLSQAERNLARIKPLWEQKVVSQKDYDDTVSALQISQADLKGVQAQIKQARLNVSYTQINAPISGVVGLTQKNEGTYITGSDVLLTTISQLNPIHVYFGLPDVEQQKIRTLTANGLFKAPSNNQYVAKIKQADGSFYGTTGVVSFTDVAVNPNTGTTQARAELANPQYQLRAGQFVHVVLEGGERLNALTVPQRAVVEGPMGKMVMVVNKENKIEPRPVNVGEWATINNTESWVIDSGLQEGERVLVDGLFKAMPNSVVTPVDAATLAAKTPSAPTAAP